MNHDEHKSEKKFIPALGYDFLTAWYDATIRITMPEKKFRNELINRLKPEPLGQIFEFGYGTGANLAIASSRSPNSSFFGLDIDPKVREIAFSKLKDKDILVDLQLYNGDIFPYDDAVFDKAYSCLVFHQLDYETKATLFQGNLPCIEAGRQAHHWRLGQSKEPMDAHGLLHRAASGRFQNHYGQCKGFAA